VKVRQSDIETESEIERKEKREKESKYEEREASVGEECGTVP
jgi:hypothetical protein